MMMTRGDLNQHIATWYLSAGVACFSIGIICFAVVIFVAYKHFKKLP